MAGVGQDQGSEEPMLLLRERAGARRYVAIWVGAVEATAVAAAATSTPLPRPLTHRLLLDVVEAFGAQLRRVEVTAIVDDQFHAEIELEVPGRGVVGVSARASDAIALAVHQRCPIEVNEAVLAEAALPAGAVMTSTDDDPAEAGEAAAPDPVEIESELEKLRQDLAGATPDDFRSDDDEPERGSE